MSPLKDPESRRRWQQEYYRRRKEEIDARNRAWREENRERLLAAQRAYHASHRDEHLAANKARYHGMTVEQRKAANKASREKNLEVNRERERAWRTANAEKMRVYRSAYRKKNPEQSADNAALRRARQRGLPWERISRQTVIERDDGWCHICGYAVDPENWHMDHVIPIARGGPHLYSNVATSHPICNWRKNARLLEAVA